MAANVNNITGGQLATSVIETGVALREFSKKFKLAPLISNIKIIDESVGICRGCKNSTVGSLGRCRLAVATAAMPPTTWKMDSRVSWLAPWLATGTGRQG